MLSLIHTKSFLAVLDARGIRAVARQLGLAPSTVLDHLDQLEADLAAPLLIRQRGIVATTPAGERFLPLARALIETAERACAAIADGPLRVAASSNLGTYMLQDQIARFKKDHPAGAEVWIGANPVVAERLATGRADVAVMEWWDDRPGFTASVWRREPLVLIVPPDHRWAGRRRISVGDLAGEPLLGGEGGTGTGTLLRHRLGPAFARLRTVGGFGNTEAVKRAVRAGQGVSIVLAAAVEDEVAAGVLAIVPIGGVTLAKDIRVVVRSTQPRESNAARFLALLTGPPVGHKKDSGPVPRRGAR